MDTNTKKAVTFDDVRVPLMLTHAANRTLWGYVIAISHGIQNGTVAMDGELRDKLGTVRKAAEIGNASIESLFERMETTPPAKDPKLEFECVTALCVVMATADKTCLNDQAKETK